MSLICVIALETCPAMSVRYLEGHELNTYYLLTVKAELFIQITTYYLAESSEENIQVR